MVDFVLKIEQNKHMSKKEKLIAKLMNPATAINVTFAELKTILTQLGFSIRTTNGSHHICSHPLSPEIINIQPLPGGKAKPYQIKQARDIINKYNLI